MIERNGKRGLEQQLLTPASQDNSTTFTLLPKSKDYYHLNSLTHSQLNIPPFYYHFSRNNWIKTGKSYGCKDDKERLGVL